MFGLTFGRKKSARSATRAKPGPLAWLKAIAWRRALTPLMVLAVLAAGVFALRLVLDQPLEKVAVEGRFQRVSPLDVEKAVREVAGRQGLVAADLDKISAAVRRIPWVDRASVARRWPDGLSVQVEEQVPVARWGETGLVNLRGEVFVNDARHIPAELPELVGPEGTEGTMTQRYLAAKGPLEGVGMRLSQLRLDARGAWELALDNGVALRLGRARIDERFERFVDVAARIVGPRAAEIAYVDLRYANGFSIGWRGARGGQRG
ncbi:MAG: cell division protein FtsQ/DivIB [Steroidobacteraceae bacterium]